MDDLISRQAAIDAFFTATSDGDKAEWCEYVIKTLPSVQTITPCYLDSPCEYQNEDIELIPFAPTENIDQIRRERDVAIQQLADLGYGLGEKQKVGKWIGHKLSNGKESIDKDVCSECGNRFREIAETGCIWNFCPICGAKMEVYKNDKRSDL